LFKKSFKYLFICLCFASHAKGVDDQYLDQLNSFREELCSYSSEFEGLYKQYQQNDFYIPIYNGHVLKKAIEEGTQYLEQEISWINQELEKLKKLSEKPITIYFELEELKEIFNKARLKRKQFYLTGAQSDWNIAKME